MKMDIRSDIWKKNGSSLIQPFLPQHVKSAGDKQRMSAVQQNTYQWRNCMGDILVKNMLILC